MASLALVTAVILAAGWGALALWFQLPGPVAVRVVAIAAWCLLGLGAAACIGRRKRWPQWARLALPGFGAALVALLAWWSTLTPSHDRVWADDVARLLEAEVDGSRVTLHNVRNFDWRTPEDYTPRWETRGYDLDRLVSADLVMSYWMGPAIAHTLVSFGFEDGQRVVFSLEIRKERHESFSAIGGFFREFEQVLVAADENDIVRTRSNARGEDVYLYHLDLPPETLRALFTGYLDEAAALRRQPAFYNTLTSNCTTIIFELARRIAPGIPMDYRLLLSGYFARYVHELGGLAEGYEYEELQRRGYINPRATALPPDARSAVFSRVIRQGVPGTGGAEATP
ncbi:DUF4105 domain-containing protein [Lysobacter sp. GX 14042]|uniref:Lnb N-terminal periplasmic domain-containing protein n=1 Tax=Lysobacter sp. GX 14042 TaxID=2907155 RepID=UPI001F455F56|nr:DUF4105 domain-containing protein [Lysobacter sp. GX 14042]MCE7031442.1 DUF4105 domain-containing protein [Lysobacter sp. GX 14042]